MSETVKIVFDNNAAASKFLDSIKDLTEREAAEKHGLSISLLRTTRTEAKKITKENK